MSPNRRRVIERYLATGNPKACGVNYSLLRRYVREACAELGCPETMLAVALGSLRRKRRATAVHFLDLGLL